MDYKADLSHLISELRVLLDDYKIDKVLTLLIKSIIIIQAFEIVQKIRNDKEM